MSFFQKQNDIETRLCTAVNAAITARNADELQAIVLLEPPFPPDHQKLIESLQRKYPKNDNGSEDRLAQLVKRVVTETAESQDEEGRPVQSWSAMVTFIVGWMTFLRDMDVDNLVQLFQLLSDLQQQANSALQHPVKGILMLPTIMNYAKVFARIAVGLDKNPTLIQYLIADSVDDEGKRESLPEKAANIVRQAFITCLNDRNTTPGGVRDGKPDGKKIGIYKMANICLKILFQAGKLESCMTIFKNIMNSSPPLHIYPAAERVTYLYYLGRYQLANRNFYGAQLVLQQAYDDCLPQFVRQRRLILVNLIASNLILGRFATEHVYNRPEADGFREIFAPITRAIRKGDLESFRRITTLDLTHPSAEFLLHYRIFYQIRNYCEVLLWRSLIRKVFMLEGAQGGTAQSAAVLDLHAVLLVFKFLERRAKIKNPAVAALDRGAGRRNFGHIYQDHESTNKSTYIDPDFVGIDGIVPYNHETDMLEVECMCASLITQDLLNAYISHKSSKLAISGARRPGGSLKYGFPQPWQVIKKKNTDVVVGWKRDSASQGQGQVVRLSGARPAGA